jgi:hypothetical protein
MSLNISAYGSAIANQLLSYLLSRPSSTQNTSSGSSTPSTPANTANNTLTGTSKPSLSSDVLSTMFNLQNNSSTSGSFRDPAVFRPTTVNEQPASEPAVSVSPAHDNMIRAIGRVPVSNTSSAPEAAPVLQAAADTDDADDTDSSSDATAGNIAAQSSLRI